MAHRRRCRLTQAELADRTGLSVRAIREIETGRVRVPRPASVRLLADAFGLDGPERDDFYAQAGPYPAETGAPARVAVPAQLPHDVPAFTGRSHELAWLDRMAAGTDEPSTVVISAVSGTAGVGKTALAVHWAHRAAGRFPDGQLYVNLRGYDPEQPTSAADALTRFLTALGVPSGDIPLDVDELATRYRTEVARRRMLIVLDNALSAEQVRPLLPGAGPSVVVVTSRDSLAGLVAVDGVRRLDVDLLPTSDAVALLHRLVGARVAAEPEAAVTLAGWCARLPLALRIAAELAVSRPESSLAELLVELGAAEHRLNLLASGSDPRAAVTAVFSWSYRHLPAAVARTFRLLAWHPGPDLDLYAAAALAGTDLTEARRAVDDLARAHLVHPAGAARYSMHDLLRAYTVSLPVPDHDSDPKAALDRLFDYYLATAAAAIDTLYPAEAHRRPPVRPVRTPTPDLADPAAALAWLDAERGCLVAVAGYAAAHDVPTCAATLSAILYRYLDGGHYAEALAVHGYALEAAVPAGDLAGQAQAQLGLGAVHLRLGRYSAAAQHFDPARTLFQRLGDRIGEARALGNLGTIDGRLGRHREAAGHYEEALVLLRQAGDRAGQTVSLINLSILERRLGQLDRAAEHIEQALALSREAGDRGGEANALTNLALIEQKQGRHDRAAAHLEQALALHRKLGNRSGEAWALDSLGEMSCQLGRGDQAIGYHRQALALFRELGDHDGEAWALNGLGVAADAADRPAEALAHHTAALASATGTGSRDQEARAHAGLGHAYQAVGDPARARTHYEQAFALYTELGLPQADDMRVLLDVQGDGWLTSTR
jgi:tetratricopeptide (TPR) repeat protein